MIIHLIKKIIVRLMDIAHDYLKLYSSMSHFLLFITVYLHSFILVSFN